MWPLNDRVKLEFDIPLGLQSSLQSSFCERIDPPAILVTSNRILLQYVVVHYVVSTPDYSLAAHGNTRQSLFSLKECALRDGSSQIYDSTTRISLISLSACNFLLWLNVREVVKRVESIYS
jgi:hypothetical protein